MPCYLLHMVEMPDPSPTTTKSSTWSASTPLYRPLHATAELRPASVFDRDEPLKQASGGERVLGENFDTRPCRSVRASCLGSRFRATR
jgi:hypothetical protein